MKRFNFKSIFFKNFTIFFMLMMLVLIFVAAYIYNATMTSIRKEIDAINVSTNQNFETMCEKMFRESEYIASKIAINTNIRNYILEEGSVNLFSNLEDNICSEVQKYKGINTYLHSIYVYSGASDSVCNGNSIIDAETFEEGMWMKDINKSNEKEFLAVYRKVNNKYPNVVSFVKFVNDYEHSGVVVVNIDLGEFAKNFNSSDKNQMKYIIGGDNTVLYANDASLIFEKLDNAQISEALSKDDVYSEIASQYYDWKYICITKADAYKNEIKLSIYGVLSICLAMFIITIIFGTVFARESSKPIKTIAEMFDEIDDSYIDDMSDYEVECIVENIMKLINKNKDLEKELESELKRMSEIKYTALQLQINPHFLNNTLNMIGIKARKENADSKIPKMIHDLAKLMIISMDNRHELITVRQECEYMNIYADLLKQRYGDIIELQIRDNGLGNAKVIRLILQPLVENAVFHGILKSKHRGIISIVFEKMNEDLSITVADNGAGMTAQECERLNRHVSRQHALEDKEHLGLKNVNERIKIMFGNNYGVRIFSQENKGTSIVVTLPLRQ